MPNPFGIEGGGTPSSSFADYFITFSSVPNPHPDFVNYSGTWSPEKGLTSIFASTQTYVNDPACAVARGVYERVRNQLERVYGPFEDQDYRDEFASAAGSDIWYAMSAGQLFFMSSWSEEARSRLDARIKGIQLNISALSDFGQSMVALEYTFEGHEVRGAPIGYGLEAL